MLINIGKLRVIAIDGPAGSGKSTIAKMLAEKLGCLYIDTGAMYRAVALAFLEATSDATLDHSNVTPDSDLGSKEQDETTIENLLKDIDIKLINESHPNGLSQKVFLNDRDVTKEIRTNLVSANVSYVSSFKSVRNKLVEMQRELGSKDNVVMDGRDIGTVVFPNADIKIFLTASPIVRAKRRLKDLEAMGEKINLDDLIREIELRDKKDSERKESPMKKADGAVEINTDSLSIDEVVDEILGLCSFQNSNK